MNVKEPTSQTVLLHEGALAELGAILRQLGAKNIFFVADDGAYAACGAAKSLEPLLDRYEVTRFSGFEPNPKLEDVERGVELFRAAQPDLLIALGGGTAIDLGKLIAQFAAEAAQPRKLAQGKAVIEQRRVPLIAIPTTAGTGSEATHYAVVYVDGEKFSVAHNRLLPCYAIIDPLLTHSLPPRITAATGLDAFCQAIESIWAVGAEEESVEYAAGAVRLALEHLVPAVNNPTRIAREAMVKASHLAGKAINISKTTLSHAISYAITSEYGLPHGQAVAITLRQVLKFNAGVSQIDCADPRGAEHVVGRIALILELLGAESVASAGNKIKQLLAAVGAPASLAEIGIGEQDCLRLAEQVNAERLSNNPRLAGREDLAALLREDSVSIQPLPLLREAAR